MRGIDSTLFLSGSERERGVLRRFKVAAMRSLGLAVALSLIGWRISTVGSIDQPLSDT